jgi:hypothetical protein
VVGFSLIRRWRSIVASVYRLALRVDVWRRF